MSKSRILIYQNLVKTALPICHTAGYPIHFTLKSVPLTLKQSPTTITDIPIVRPCGSVSSGVLPDHKFPHSTTQLTNNDPRHVISQVRITPHYCTPTGGV
jgi:hypothetical protein